MKLKVKFIVQPTKVSNVPKGANSILLTWRRGAKRHSGVLKVVDVNPKLNEGFWNEEFVVESRIEVDAKDALNLAKFDPKNFEEKSLSISVKDGKKSGVFKKHKLIGKVKVNLSEFINGSAKAITITKPLDAGSKRDKPCEITLTIKAELLKLGTKTLSVVQTPQQGSTITLDGCNFALKQEEAHTETTIDNKSEDDSDEENIFGEDEVEEAEKTEQSEKSAEKGVLEKKGSGAISPTTEKKETISPSTSPTIKEEKTTTSPVNNSSSELLKRAVPTAAKTAAPPAPTPTTPSITPAKTSGSVVRYHKFSDRPLTHKVLASIVILCALLAIRIALV